MFSQIEEDITPVIESMGYHLIEISCHLNQKTLAVTLFVYKKDGIKSEDCDNLILALRGRIQTLIYPTTLSLSVSSPGLYRTLKSSKEYPLFVGRKMRIILHNGLTIEDTLQAADSQGITIAQQQYSYGEIIKGKLI